ncbi:hypothetical protein J4462_02450 [Candidatus Pacearchaeota archaeon]|nr:hypothetical protein [Candidatus Pacearchaeota archaeon]
MADITESYQRIANLKNMAERTKIPLQRERFLAEAKQEESDVRGLLKEQRKTKVITKTKIVNPTAKQIRQLRKLKQRQLSSRKISKGVLGLTKAFLSPYQFPKRRLSSQQRFNLLRLKQLQQQNQQLYNTNPNQVLLDYYQRKAQQLQQERSKNEKLSSNTKRLMDEVMRIQNLSRVRDSQQQRRNRERKLLANVLDLMKTPNIFAHANMDFTRLPEGDKSILNAPNIFKEDQANNPSILRPRVRNILDTGEDNTLRF